MSDRKQVLHPGLASLKNIFLTKDGLAKFEAEKSDLTEKRKGAVLSLTRARDMGDLSENGFYKAARHELSEIDRRLRELTYIIKYSDIIEKSNTKMAELGSTVKVSVDGKEMKYQIVGKYEANPKLGMISNESPIGRSLIGKKIGDKFDFETDKKYSYEIVSIN